MMYITEHERRYMAWLIANAMDCVERHSDKLIAKRPKWVMDEYEQFEYGEGEWERYRDALNYFWRKVVLPTFDVRMRQSDPDFRLAIEKVKEYNGGSRSRQLCREFLSTEMAHRIGPLIRADQEAVKKSYYKQEDT